MSTLRHIHSLDDPGSAAPGRATHTERERRRVLDLYGRLFHTSAAMREVEAAVLRAVAADEPVIVEGETGTGKGVVAEVIHALSERASGPWIRMRCGALPGERIDAELFGEELPAPAGERIEFAGCLDAAADGTLFLDEVTDLPTSVQARLLHLIDHNAFYRNGSRRPRAAAARVIVSTHRDIRRLVDAGSFRADLYQRLAATSIHVPPLRDRREEIAPLVEHFRLEHGRELHSERPPMTARTMDALVAYPWPGNVREIDNLVRRYVLLGDERHVRDELARRAQRPVPAAVAPRDGESLRTLSRRVAREAEHAVITDVLVRVHGNRAEAARRLKVSYKTLLAKLKTPGALQ